MNLTSWVLSIVGMIIISVIAEIIIPMGQTSKVIKGVMAFIVVLVIASPLPNLFSGSIDVSKYFDNEDYSINEDLSNTIFDIRLEMTETQLKNSLEERGVSNIEIVIIAQNDETFLLIEKIAINLDNAVIKEINGNKIDVETIITIVAEVAGITQEQVFIV